MINIYDINDKLLIQAEITSAAVREQEMSKSDYIQLSFSASEKIILPVGAYIEYSYKIDKVREVTQKFLLLESYEPTQSNESAWKYTPEFQHPKMILSKTPFFIYTRNSKNEEIKQNVWSFVGTTRVLCKKIEDYLNNDIKFGRCGWTCYLNMTIANAINVSFSDNDFISALSAICNAIGDNCEWHIDYDNEVIYIGKVVIGDRPIKLEVGKNVGIPSLSESKENYYNAFSVFGGTRNITQVNDKGENISSGDIRLQLKEGAGSIEIDGKQRAFTVDRYSTIDLREDKNKEPLFTKVLDFSDIFPSLNTYVYDVRGREKYIFDENNKKIPLSYNSDGSVKKYKTFTVWYMRLAYPTTEKISEKTLVNTTVDNGVTHYWYDFEITDDLLVNGKNIGCSFEANFLDGALSTPLAGRGTNGDYVGFELTYHKENIAVRSGDDVSDKAFNIRKGDYEIIYQEDNDVIIPSNADSMLIPRGEDKPSLKCNITVLYNIAMDEATYKDDAQKRLLDKAKTEIIRLLSDLNNYAVKSYPNVFMKDNLCLQIGQNVTYNDGHGYELETRVLKLSTNIDYDFIQEITVGNQAIKGTITQLKDDVQTIIANGSGGNGGGSYTAAQLNNLIARYGTNYFISKLYDDTAQGTITFNKVQRFMEGLVLGDKTHYVDGNGNAVLRDVALDRIHDPKSTPAERVIIGAQGFDLYMGDDNKAHLYLDYLTVRNKAFFSALELRKVSYSGGTLLMSNAGSTIVKVVYIFDESGENVIAYKCYAKADDGTTATNNWWKVGMMALCQTFNVKSGVYKDISNRYYWRLCIGAGQETLEDGKLYDWVILSNIKEFGGGDAILPSYALRILADENRNYLSWGGILVAVNNKEANTSLANLLLKQDGITQDDANTSIADRTFYGYEEVDNGEPDAPQVGDVIVNVGDQVKWNSRGNVIKLTTSTEDDQSGTAPAMTMYHGIGAPRTTEAGKINVWQWETVTALISPAAVTFNASFFKLFTDDPNKSYDPWEKNLEQAKSYTNSQLKVTNDSIEAFTKKIQFNEDGTVANISKSGLITTDNMSTQFSALVDTKGKILALARLSTAIVTNEELKADDYDEATYKILKDLCKPISEVRISGDMIDINAEHVLNITGSYLRITSTNFTLDGTGKLTTNSAVLNSATINHADINKAKLNDVVIRGSLVSPWQQTGTYLDIGTGKVSYPVANNIAAGGEGGWGDGDVDKIFNWDSNDSGRLIRLAAFDKKGGDTVGFTLTSKNGCYFYENGTAHSTIVGNNEILELIGYGDSSKFYGYIVVSRKYIYTPYSYGPSFNPIAYGKVAAGYNYGPNITYATCNLSTMTVTRLSEGRYKLSFPGLKFLKKEHTMIMVTGYMDLWHLSDNVGDTPLKASVDEIDDGYAIISVSDDSSRNEGSFFFMIYNMYDWDGIGA